MAKTYESRFLPSPNLDKVFLLIWWLQMAFIAIRSLQCIISLSFCLFQYDEVYIFVNVCVRYEGTKCCSQKISLKNFAENECALRCSSVNMQLKLEI